MDLSLQQECRVDKGSRLEVYFLESVFRANAAHPVMKVLDLACGNGPLRSGWFINGNSFHIRKKKLKKEKAQAV
jgi:hypothetical protein